ncbi:MAG TPA: cytochrome c oxidase assembly protein [Solirubrobacterales bacterium]|jgi:cytochrome c oxidase assembly factor CtaG
MLAALTTPLDWTGGPALLWVLTAGILYWRGGRESRRTRRAADRWRTAAFLGGLAAIMLALDSPIDTLADELFWVHMIQHILLISVSAPLLVLARPWNRMWRGVPLEYRRAATREFVRNPRLAPLRRALALCGTALLSWLIFNLNFVAWHLPALYDLALRSPPIHAFEHLTFFATALLLWTRVIYSPPWRSPLSELGKLAYLGSTLVVGWILAIVLALATSPVYSAYADMASRPGHISAFTDQQLAAGVMWVPGSISYTIAILLIAYHWLQSTEGRERTAVNRGAPPARQA